MFLGGIEEKTGIAVGTEQTTLRCQSGPGAVCVDGAALEHHPGSEHRQPARRGDAGGDGVVQVVRGVFFAPRIVFPIDDGAAGFILHDHRPVVAAPWLVGGVMKKRDTFMERTMGRQLSASFRLMRGIVALASRNSH